MSRTRLITATTAAFTAIIAFGGTAPFAAAATGPGQQQQQTPTAANGQPVAGMSCDAQEGQRIHIHQHLLIFDHGQQVQIPPNIGQPAGKRCIYWVHTHTADGIIHIEAPLNRSFTLGDFFAVWGEPLGRTQVASAKAAKGETVKVWVNGKAYTGDPKKIDLAAHADIVIEAGPPFSKPPVFSTWGPL